MICINKPLKRANIFCVGISELGRGEGGVVAIWWNIEIGLFSQRNAEKLYILADFGKQEYCPAWTLCILKDRIRQSSNPTDTDIT